MASTGSASTIRSSAIARDDRRAGPRRGLIGSAVYLTLSLTSAAFAATADDLKRGEELLMRHCSRCHAAGPAGDSPRPDAPAFRVLGKLYPIDSLEESLGEGLSSGHPDMPEMSFEANDVGAIIDYLKSIQVR